MPKVPSPRGARPRHDIRLRVLAALTSEPSTAVAIAERSGIPGRERGMHAACTLVRLEADGLAVSELRRNVTRWRSAAAARHASALLWSCEMAFDEVGRSWIYASTEVRALERLPWRLCKLVAMADRFSE